MNRGNEKARNGKTKLKKLFWLQFSSMFNFIYIHLSFDRHMMKFDEYRFYFYETIGSHAPSRYYRQLHFNISFCCFVCPILPSKDANNSRSIESSSTSSSHYLDLVTFEYCTILLSRITESKISVVAYC